MESRIALGFYLGFLAGMYMSAVGEPVEASTLEWWEVLLSALYLTGAPAFVAYRAGKEAPND